MNKQNSFSNKTIEALKMGIDDAIKFVAALNEYEDSIKSKPLKTLADSYVFYAIPVIKFLATSLQEALAQAEKQEWQSLTGREIDDVFNLKHPTYKEFARDIDAKLKEKNGGG